MAIEITEELIGKKIFYVRDYNAYERFVTGIKDEFVKLSDTWYRKEEIEVREILKWLNYS